ncbi:MAG: [NiFe]-hydrogenase assembly chaperone HybE [Azonexus sp.]
MNELPHDNPAPRLAAHYQSLWEAGGQDMAEINPRLAVEAVGFTRHEGDWLGVVITPWFLRLFLLPGGGSLWGEIPVGQSRYLSLPTETMQFVADQAAELGAFQYCTLIEPTSLISDMAAARQMAERVMQPFGYLPPAAPISVSPEPPAPAGVSRRGFFRRLAGKR